MRGTTPFSPAHSARSLDSMANSYWQRQGSKKRPPFMIGAVVLLGWFLWNVLKGVHHEYEGWVIFYVVALLSWQPASAWLTSGMRWLPAAELFFLLHLPYYVAPFVSGNKDRVEVGVAMQTEVGLVIALFLLGCRLCYRAPRGVATGRSGSSAAGILGRQIGAKRGRQFAWEALIAWFLFTITIQQGWFPDFGSFFEIVRMLFASGGAIGTSILFFEMGGGRLDRTSKVCLIVVTVLTLLFALASGFLIDGAVQISIIILAFFIGRKRLPILAILVSAGVMAFLQAGKGDMRAEFWDKGNNYSSIPHNPVNIYQVWIGASWNRLATQDAAEEGAPSLLERGNLLRYLNLVVTQTPGLLPYMEGITYKQTATIFVPRFLWLERPRASLPDETLAIHYGVQTNKSVNSTAIGLGRICEAWANFGWAGVFTVGALMGLILQIPTRLSAGFSPRHFRFLLAVPFIMFAMNLEASLGYAIHALSHALVFSFVCLWVVSTPATRRRPIQQTRRARSSASSTAQREVSSPPQ